MKEDAAKADLQVGDALQVQTEHGLDHTPLLSTAPSTVTPLLLARVLPLIWVVAGALMEKQGGMFAPVNLG